MELGIDFITGVRVGFEFIPPDTAREIFGDDASFGIMVDLLIINLIFIKRS